MQDPAVYFHRNLLTPCKSHPERRLVETRGLVSVDFGNHHRWEVLLAHEMHCRDLARDRIKFVFFAD